MQIGPAEAREVEEAVALLFQHLPQFDASVRMEAARDLLENAPTDSALLLVARERERVAGAILAQSMPGALGALWPPCISSIGDEPCRDPLLAHAIIELRRRGAKVIQSILTSGDRRLAESLLRGGFVHPTSLCYLLRKIRGDEESDGDFISYGESDRVAFDNAMYASMNRSLDFPELDGKRTRDEVFEGYRSAGFDADRTWASLGYRGVALASAQPNGWELAYIGVVPSARRSGVGRLLLRKVIAEARKARVRELTASMDARNLPARMLYRTEGFDEFDRREVYLHFVD